MAHFQPAMKEFVGALVARIGTGEPSFQGTCFLVQVSNNHGLIFDYLVTAKHVRNALFRDGKAYLRVNKGKVGTFNQGTVDLPLPKSGWLVQP
jgi:hypothetical protein